ncbi:MAG: hypothetical protein H0Z28_05655 [Archaeoglobus sp.]|nr:hypothetical protein [Archaeoglobus sp.]
MEIDLELVRNVVGRDEFSERAIGLVLENSGNGRIEFESLTNDDFEVFLTLTHFKLALPVNSINDSLSWNSRILNATTKKLEIPYIIRFIFSELRRRGKVSFEKAVIEYFKAIGEKRPEEFPEIILETYNSAENFLVCGNEITKISEKYDRDGGVVISELKGAGIISPFSGCGGSFQAYGKKFGSPVYEVNRFLYEVVKVLNR